MSVQDPSVLQQTAEAYLSFTESDFYKFDGLWYDEDGEEVLSPEVTEYFEALLLTKPST